MTETYRGWPNHTTGELRPTQDSPHGRDVQGTTETHYRRDETDLTAIQLYQVEPTQPAPGHETSYDVIRMPKNQFTYLRY